MSGRETESALAKNYEDFQSGNWEKPEHRQQYPEKMYVEGLVEVTGVGLRLDTAYNAMREQLIYHREFEHLRPMALAYGYLKGLIQPQLGDPDLPRLLTEEEKAAQEKRRQIVSELQQKIDQIQREGRLRRQEKAGIDFAEEAIEKTRKILGYSLDRAFQMYTIALSDNGVDSNLLPRFEETHYRMKAAQPLEEREREEREDWERMQRIHEAYAKLDKPGLEKIAEMDRLQLRKARQKRREKEGRGISEADKRGLEMMARLDQEAITKRKENKQGESVMPIDPDIDDSGPQLNPWEEKGFGEVPPPREK